MSKMMGMGMLHKVTKAVTLLCEVGGVPAAIAKDDLLPMFELKNMPSEAPHPI